MIKNKKTGSTFQERYQEVVSYILQQKSVKVTELTERFYASESTIRRILQELENVGIVSRYYGGATVCSPDTLTNVHRRVSKNEIEKNAIGRLAASFVKDGMTITMMGGTTVEAMCPYLLGSRQITVVTNSIPVLNALCWEKNIQLVLMGGTLNPGEMEIRGPLTTRTMEQIKSDLLFVGATAMHPKFGMMTDDMDAIETYRTCFFSTERAFILVDHTKFNITPHLVVQSNDQITDVITDSGVPVDTLQLYRKLNVKVHIAKREKTEE